MGKVKRKPVVIESKSKRRLLVPFEDACERVGLTPSAVRERLKGRTICPSPFIPVRGTNGRLYVHHQDIEAYQDRLPSYREPGLMKYARFSKDFLQEEKPEKETKKNPTPLRRKKTEPPRTKEDLIAEMENLVARFRTLVEELASTHSGVGAPTDS